MEIPGVPVETQVLSHTPWIPFDPTIAIYSYRTGGMAAYA